MPSLTHHWLFWSLLSAIFAGATAILAKVGVEGINSNLATALRTTVILVFTWILASSAVSHASLAAISRRTWIFLVLSGIATGLSWLCYFRALQLGHASRVAPIDKLSVVFAVLLACAFLHEPMSWRLALGIALITAGALVVATS